VPFLDEEREPDCNARVSGDSIRFLSFPGNGQAPADGAQPRDVQELWFSLARLGWSSLVVVPVDDRCPASRIAEELADVGSRLQGTPTTAVLASSMDYESARMLADLLRRLFEYRQPSASEVPALEMAASAEGRIFPTSEGGAARAAPVRAASVPAASAPLATRRIIVALQPVVVEPLGVAIAHAADAVVVCLQMRGSRLATARRTIELIGADRISGAVLVE
jgi:hypothetical protein